MNAFMNTIKKHPWIMLMVGFIVLIVIGIAVS